MGAAPLDFGSSRVRVLSQLHCSRPPERKSRYPSILLRASQLNRLTQKTYPDSTSVAYTYDNASRLTQVSDPTGTYQFTFDNISAGSK